MDTQASRLHWYQTLLGKLTSIDLVKNLKVYWYFGKYVKPYWFRFVVCIIITFPIGMLDGAMAATIQPFFDALSNNVRSVNFQIVKIPFHWLPMVIIGFNIFQGSLNYLSYYLNAFLSGKISNLIRQDLYQKLLQFDIQQSQQYNSGFVIARFFNDPMRVQEALLGNVKTIIGRLASSLSIAAVMFSLNWKLCLIAYSIISLLVFPIMIVKKKVLAVLSKESEMYGDIFGSLTSTLMGLKVIHSFTLQNAMMNHFAAVQRRMYDNMIKISKAQAILSPINYFISSSGMAIILWYGSHLVFAGKLTAGGLIAFFTSMLMLYRPMRTLGDTVIRTQGMVMALERVIDLLESDKFQARDTSAYPTVGPLKDKIEFRNVTFKYASRNDLALSNVNFTLRRGEMVALAGRSGGGKTTVAELLLGFYDLHTEPHDGIDDWGQIYYDGQPLTDINLKSLREQIGYVSQDTFLFDGSLRHNITMGCPNATDEQIAEAIRRAHLTDFVDLLPDKLETQIGERGIRLSGGQRQRVAIARAFLKNAPVLILDEATSALDNQSEKAVQMALDDLMQDRTTLVIAHRLSTIQHADRIVVMDQGTVVETGTHEELLANRGLYYHLYHAQFETLEAAEQATSSSEEAVLVPS